MFELSDHYSTDQWEYTERDKVSYRKYTTKRFTPCDECSWVLHEYRGKGLPSRQVKVKRILATPNGTHTIRLCSGHAVLWKERDGI